MLERIFHPFRPIFCAITLGLLFSVVTPFSAHAEQLIPATPNWWPVGGFDMRHGIWLECNGGKWAKDDCIDSIDVRPVEGGEWKPMTFTPDPGFNPDTTAQIPYGGINDAAHWPQSDLTGPGRTGTWAAPTGEQLNDNNLGLVTDLGFFGSKNADGSYYSWMQFNLRTTNWSVSLSDKFQYRISIKSTSLKSYAGWSYSSAKGNTFDWSTPGYLTFTALPGIMYYPSADWDLTCAGKIDNSTASTHLEMASFFISIFGNKKDQNPPSQLTLSTNGFECFNGVAFDESSMELVLKVGTVRYDESGNQIVGWLDAYIDQDLLINWWHVDPKTEGPIVKVEATYPDGKVEVVNTVASFDGSKQALHISASGFHYPTPQVSVSVTPKVSNSGTSSISPVSAPAKPIFQVIHGGGRARLVSLDFHSLSANMKCELSSTTKVKGKDKKSMLMKFTLDEVGKAGLVLDQNLAVGTKLTATCSNLIATATITK